MGSLSNLVIIIPAVKDRGILQAEKKQLMGSGVYVTESTPLGIDSFNFVDYDICITVLHGAVCLGTWCT